MQNLLAHFEENTVQRFRKTWHLYFEKSDICLRFDNKVEERDRAPIHDTIASICIYADQFY